jgi:3-oxosteroid 1-dehydrogenase
MASHRSFQILFSFRSETGVDEDFRRGERPVQLMFNGPVADQHQKPNPTMDPIAADGPFCVGLVVGGTLDTKGGPQTDTEARMLNDADRGATLGPIIAFAYRAAQAADAEHIRGLNEGLALSSTAGARA